MLMHCCLVRKFRAGKELVVACLSVTHILQSFATDEIQVLEY